MQRTIGMVVAMVAVGVFACGASAVYVEQYEMDYSPETAAGTLNGNVMTPADGTGDYGPSGFLFSDGIGTFLDNPNSSGNQGLRLNDAGALLGHAGYFADIRIMWLGGADGNGGQKSLGFAGEPANGRGIRVDQGWLHYVSSGIVTSGGLDMTDWQDLRVIVATNGSQAVWAGPGYTNKIIEVINPGGTGVNGAIPTGPGFFLGSWGGSSTTFSNFQLDYVRIGQGVPEPTTLALLVLGALPLLRRRR